MIMTTNQSASLGARLRLAAVALLLLPALIACGFQMRGTTELPFDSLYIGIPDNTLFGADIRRSIRAASPGTVQTAVPQDAQVQLQNLGLTRDRREVSLSPQGRVEEYELSLTFTYRLIDRDGRILIPDTVLTTSRDLPYDDQVVQAKQGEMETLYRVMQRSLVDRIIRRLTAPDVREAAQRAQAARAGRQTEDLPRVAAPDARLEIDYFSPERPSAPSDFDAPGQRGF